MSSIIKIYIHAYIVYYHNDMYTCSIIILMNDLIKVWHDSTGFKDCGERINNKPVPVFNVSDSLNNIISKKIIRTTIDNTKKTRDFCYE